MADHPQRWSAYFNCQEKVTEPVKETSCEYAHRVQVTHVARASI